MQTDSACAVDLHWLVRTVSAYRKLHDYQSRTKPYHLPILPRVLCISGQLLRTSMLRLSYNGVTGVWDLPLIVRSFYLQYSEQV